MELYEAINKRHTIRDFQNYDVSDEKLERIIGAAMKAPTNDHMRDWHFIVIKDKKTVLELINKIPETFSDEQMEQLIKDWNLTDSEQQGCYRNAVPKQYRMLCDASCVIIPLLKQKVDLMKPENLSHLNGFASIWCAIENLFLAATAEELACTLRIPLGDEAEWARKVLAFPEDYLMPCFIGLGKPAEDASVIKQKNISLKDRIHFNKW